MVGPEECPREKGNKMDYKLRVSFTLSQAGQKNAVQYEKPNRRYQELEMPFYQEIADYVTFNNDGIAVPESLSKMYRLKDSAKNPDFDKCNWESIFTKGCVYPTLEDYYLESYDVDLDAYPDKVMILEILKQRYDFFHSAEYLSTKQRFEEEAARRKQTWLEEKEASQRVWEEQKALEQKAEEERKAVAKAKEIERKQIEAEWINTYGSERLKLALKYEYGYNRIYVEERLSKDLPGFVIDWEDSFVWEVKLNPSHKALLILERLKEMGFDAQISWWTDDGSERTCNDLEARWESFEPREAITIKNYLGKSYDIALDLAIVDENYLAFERK